MDDARRELRRAAAELEARGAWGYRDARCTRCDGSASDRAHAIRSRRRDRETIARRP